MKIWKYGDERMAYLAPNDIMAIIANNPIFSKCYSNEIQKLSTLFTTQHVPVGTIIVRENEIVDSVYLIQSGVAAVYHGDSSLQIACLRQGESIGLGGHKLIFDIR